MVCEFIGGILWILVVVLGLRMYRTFFEFDKFWYDYTSSGGLFSTSKRSSEFYTWTIFMICTREIFFWNTDEYLTSGEVEKWIWSQYAEFSHGLCGKWHRLMKLLGLLTATLWLNKDLYTNAFLDPISVLLLSPQVFACFHSHLPLSRAYVLHTFTINFFFWFVSIFLSSKFTWFFDFVWIWFLSFDIQTYSIPFGLILHLVDIHRNVFMNMCNNFDKSFYRTYFYWRG